MSLTITSRNFSGRFASLNGTNTHIPTHADIIRSLLTVGYPSRRAAVRVVGPWREDLLVAMATGYLDAFLRTTPYYRNLEQTEKVGVSFLFGEAFTHWYAQSQMNVPFLLHVAGLASCHWASSTTPVSPKAGATSPAPKSRPDFIGIRYRERHVFESKGRSRFPSTSTVAKALGQVSALHTVNGRTPTTRCASFFMFRANGPEGLVVDPPASGKGVDVRFDDFDAVAKAYSYFLDRPVNDVSDNVGDGYVGREIEDGVFFAIDKEIFAALQERPATRRGRLRRFLEISAILEGSAQRLLGRRDAGVSPGPDGLLLVDRRRLSSTRQPRLRE